jgi:hypothetical protein
MTTSEQHPPREEIDLEESRVARWRFDQFRWLGFGDEHAWLLVFSDADLHDTRSLVAAGCPLDLALKIAI